MPAQRTPIDREILLLIPCVERCGAGIVTKLPVDGKELEHILAKKDWFASVITPPGQPIVTAVLCTKCAERVHAPEVLAEMRQARKDRPRSGLGLERKDLQQMHGVSTVSEPTGWLTEFGLTSAMRIVEDEARELDGLVKLVPVMVAEIRKRRATDLSAEDIDTYRNLRDFVSDSDILEWDGYVAQGRVLAALDRLLAAHGAKQ